MNKSASKKTLIASAAAISLSALLFAGTTYAWFTDSASSAVSTIQSGNLDVNLYQLKKTTVTDDENNTTETSIYEAVTGSDIVFAENTEWEPGAVEVVYLKVANEGTLALTYNLSLPIYENIHATSVTNADIDLSTVLKAAVVKLYDSATFDSRAEAIAAAEKGTSVTLGTSSALTGNLEAKKDDTFAIVVYMPETTGNEANHNAAGAPSIKVGVNVAAKQYTKESDSYDDQYDANAEYASADGYPVTASTFASLLNSGGNLTLTEDVSFPLASNYEPEVIAIADGTVLDLQDSTITLESESLDITGNNLTIKNGTFQATTVPDYDTAALYIGTPEDGKDVHSDNIVLDGVTIIGGLSVYNASNVVLRNCTITGIFPEDGTVSSVLSVYKKKKNTTSVTIESGTYTTGNGDLVQGDFTDSNVTVTIKGGTFNGNPSLFVAKGYKAVKGDDGWYTVVPDTAD
jgi:predicted ribosomally synthesized peptide with SipW-like signal peptide